MSLEDTPLVATIVEQYAEVSENALLRYYRAVNESRAGTYGPTQWMSDQAAFWSDVSNLYALPLRLMKTVVALQVDAGATGAIAVIPFADPGFAIAGMALTNTTGGTIPATNINARMDTSGRNLIYELVSLGTLTLTPGKYTGTVNQTGTPDAVCDVVVTVG